MKGRKLDLLIILLAIILVGVVFAIAYFSLTANPPTTLTTSPSPTPIPTLAAANGEPPVFYNKQAQDKLLDIIQRRPTLSSEDSFAKANILSLLPPGRQSGILYESSTIRIDYTHSANVFQVEILTTDIKLAKDEANLWFRSHGVSQEGICSYPVSFYLNTDIANELRQTKMVFNPLPNGC